MGFNIGSIFNAIKLPQVNLSSAISSLTSGDFSKVTDTLKSVVSDLFSGSTDNSSQSGLNILGMNLPNPVNSLASLLGSSNALSNQVPSLNDRLTTYSAAPAQSGGGTTSTAAATTKPTTQAGGSTAAASSSGTDFATAAVDKYAGTLDSLDAQINAQLNKGGDLTESDMLKLQQQMQKKNELFQMLTQILQLEHETKKGILQNIR